jgi:hypothetical protein
MSTVVGALDTSTAARPVLEMAIRFGQLTGADVEAVYVRSDRAPGPPETLESLTADRGVPFRVIGGDVESALVAAICAPGVVAGVIGARATPSGKRPVGRTARHVLERVDRPVVVVPPELVSPGPFHHLLVPLEGEDVASRPVLEHFWPLLPTIGDGGVEVVVLHVFDAAHSPVMLDQPGYCLEILGKEFLARHLPGADRIELRRGPVGPRVAEVSKEYRTDLVVLSWSQDTSVGRARVVQEVLGASAVPVLLLPTTPSPAGRPAPASAPAGS